MWARNVALVLIGVLSGMVAWLVTTWYIRRPVPMAVVHIADATTASRGSIAGVVAIGGVPVARTGVCANPLSPRVLAVEPLPRCTQTDDAGRYALGSLLAGAYRIVALTTPSTSRDITVMADERREDIWLGPGHGHAVTRPTAANSLIVRRDRDGI